MNYKMSNEEQNELSVSDNLKNVKNKVIVLSGKGGVGKSTVAVNSLLTGTYKL